MKSASEIAKEIDDMIEQDSHGWPCFLDGEEVQRIIKEAMDESYRRGAERMREMAYRIKIDMGSALAPNYDIGSIENYRRKVRALPLSDDEGVK